MALTIGKGSFFISKNACWHISLNANASSRLLALSSILISAPAIKLSLLPLINTMPFTACACASLSKVFKSSAKLLRRVFIFSPGTSMVTTATPSSATAKLNTESVITHSPIQRLRLSHPLHTQS